ncbi:RHS repeat-associated core domain-containing protein [Flavobacterium sp. NRK F10]|uniref:RHS repeat domain-containing protein n=1 Tax=Flavobacterium sp. NRK F10 TaxID=2954931 RepID=UPI002091D333|nr:RHS repeat-associated core domain-containing protein [Flavobacterium sp. NRK F10]MCO6174100.1 RHS repeat-associated core domain-containing protein [Flavobacterium sp. NRK F10]
MKFFPHAKGYVNVTEACTIFGSCGFAYNYVFNYTDHLGNIRLSYGIDPETSTLKIMEENHYYPFGLKHANYNSDELLYQKGTAGAVVLKGPTTTVESVYKYKYNGKELQDELGFNMYDYGARNYDPALGRWMNIDPLAEKYYNVNSYTYAVNNPIFFIDPDGMQVDTDYKISKDKANKGDLVRVDPNDGSENNATDRILETDKKGNVKTKTVKNQDGTKSEETKVLVNDIAKGIVKEGMNFRNGDNIIAYGGENQPTLDDVVSFLVQFSENIANAEMSGYEVIGDVNRNQNYIFTNKYTDKYGRTDFQRAYGKNYKYGQRVSTSEGTIIIMSHFHTHPSNTGLPDKIDEPSAEDLIFKSKRNSPLEMGNYIYNIHGRFKY